MIGHLHDNEIEKLLHQNCIGRIGCHSGNTTYVVPISYAYDGQYIYGYSHEGLKLHIMRQNPDVCFEVDSLENMANWQSAICWGRFEELENEAEKKAAISLLLNRTLPMMTSSTVKITPHWPFGPAESEHLEGVLYRIRLQKKTGRFEQSDSAYFYAT